jgi:hypothetical protein
VAQLPIGYGSYVCGDLGKCSGCPDNQYCSAGQTRPIGSEEPRTQRRQQGEPSAEQRAGVASTDAWTCPVSHPIKGNFTTYSGERCIYHRPGGAFYGKTRPERCYASEEEAVRDGCRPSKR